MFLAKLGSGVRGVFCGGSQILQNGTDCMECAVISDGLTDCMECAVILDGLTDSSKSDLSSTFFVYLFFRANICVYIYDVIGLGSVWVGASWGNNLVCAYLCHNSRKKKKYLILSIYHVQLDDKGIDLKYLTQFISLCD